MEAFVRLGDEGAGAGGGGDPAGGAAGGAMCLKCSQAVEKLRRRAHMTMDEALNFLWSWTAFPAGDNALERVTQFLRVKPRNRRRWFARQATIADRMMAAARRKTATRGKQG